MGCAPIFAIAIVIPTHSPVKNCNHNYIRNRVTNRRCDWTIGTVYEVGRGVSQLSENFWPVSIENDLLDTIWIQDIE